MIFIDSDAYIGLFVSTDIHHAKAIHRMQEIHMQKEQLITSWDVIDEVATKITYFFTKEAALTFLSSLKTSDTRVEYVNELTSTLVAETFVEQSSKKVSLTDCVNIVLAKQLGIKTIFSFDHHYRQNGFKLLGDR